MPHAKFRLLLKSEKEAQRLEKKRQKEKEKAGKDGKQDGKDVNVPTAPQGSDKKDSSERTHADMGDRHPGWTRPGPKTRVIRSRFAHALSEHYPHLWDKANTFWDELKNSINKAESI